MNKCPKCKRTLMRDGSCYCAFTPSSNETNQSKTIRLILKLVIIAAYALAFGLNFIIIDDKSRLFPYVLISLIGLIAALPGLYLCTTSNDKVDSMCYSLENGTGCVTVLLFGLIPFIIIRLLLKEIPRVFLRAYGVLLVATGILLLLLPALTWNPLY